MLDLSVTVSDLMRTLLLLWGTTLAMLAFKFAYISIRNGQGFRAYGLGSYGFLALTPVMIGLFDYGSKIILPAAASYMVALILGTLSVRAVMTITPEWVRLLAADRKRRKRDRLNDHRETTP